MEIAVRRNVRKAPKREVEKEMRVKAVEKIKRGKAKRALPHGTMQKVLREIRDES